MNNNAIFTEVSPKIIKQSKKIRAYALQPGRDHSGPIVKAR